MRTWFIGALALLAACGSEEPAPRAESRPACVPQPRVCGLAPPQRPAPGGTAYKVATVTGERFWVVVPAELAPRSGVVAVPDAPMRLKASLTTAAPREAAGRFCDGFPACEPTAVGRERIPLARWDDASGTIRDLEVTTLDLGAWTLVLEEPDAAKAESVARAITSSADEDGYPLLKDAVDADWASVMLWVGHHFIQVIPGCELTAKRPDLGGVDAGPQLELHAPEAGMGGTWCAGGRYWVDVSFTDRPTLELLHEKLRILQVDRDGGAAARRPRSPTC